MADAKKYEVVVIGGGPGGYAAAFKAADLGKKVAIIDPEDNPGGVCLYRGCIPSKALLHVARQKKEAEEASEIGLSFGKPKIDLDKIRNWKNKVVKDLTTGLGQLSKQRKIDFIKGYGSFSDEHTLKISDNKEIDQVSFKHAIIATGSKAVSLPGIDSEMKHILYAEKALDIEEMPERLLIIGGGYIGLEMGTVYQSLGSKVSIVEMASGFLPGADTDLVKVFSDSNKDFFEDVRFDTTVKGIRKKKNGIEVVFENKKGGKTTEEFDRAMIAIGRKPVTENLGIEKIGIEVEKTGFIAVDNQRRTSLGHIFAIGDVAGEPLLAHKATHEGIIAAEAIAGHASYYEPKAIPAVVYTDPEIAWCGLMEMEAKNQGRSIKVVKFPWSASGRAKTLGRKDGLTKMIIDPETERILGVGIVGPQAGDLISEGALAIEMAAVAADLALTIHPHPTLSETVMEAAELFYGSSTHKFRRIGNK
jgi:dihydrolipoamide dehydrogenase